MPGATGACTGAQVCVAGTTVKLRAWEHKQYGAAVQADVLGATGRQFTKLKIVFQGRSVRNLGDLTQLAGFKEKMMSQPHMESAGERDQGPASWLPPQSRAPSALLLCPLVRGRQMQGWGGGGWGAVRSLLLHVAGPFQGCGKERGPSDTAVGVLRAKANTPRDPGHTGLPCHAEPHYKE